MQLYWKPLITVGKHVAPSCDPLTGKLCLKEENVTPGRIAHFVDAFKRLHSQGINFPVPFGHKLMALPEERFDDDEEFRQILEKANESKILGNAGFIEDMRVSPKGDLEYAMYPPPGFSVCQETNDLINPSTGNRIREVSAGIGNWRDGKGQLHKDIIVHAALCTMPVVAGMGRFTANSGSMTTLSAGDSIEFTCWLSTLTGGQSVAIKDKKKKPGDEDLDDVIDTPEEDDDDIFEDENGEGLNDAVEPPAEEVVAPLDEPVEPLPTDLTPPKTTNPDHVHACIDMLTTAGLPLPPDTDEGNFFERLLTALTVVAGMGGKFELADQQTTNETQPPPAAGSSEQPPQPEAPPTMMSLDAIVDRTARRFAKDKQKQVRKELAQAWEGLKRLGCPVDICNREIAKVTQVQLSLNTATQRLRLPSQVGKVRIVQEILSRISGEEVQTQLSTIALPNPLQNTDVAKGASVAVSDKMSDGEDRQAWMDRQAQSMFGPNAKAARI